MKKRSVLSEDLIPFIEEEIKERDISFLIKGDSMRPFFKSELTRVSITKVGSLSKYDVILYKYQKKYLMHRVIKISDDNLVCRGDGLISKEVIKLKDVIGVVKSHETNKGQVSANNKWYLFKVRLWHYLKPIRRVLLKFIRS